ncbi:MAG: TonB-dependent receptor, partial [Muribaculaceae bacterium]|nr:TonB-dependent receptor [Muribaculaceae bacterium]
LSLRYLGDLKPVKWFGTTLGLQVDNVRTKGKLNSIGQSAYNSTFGGQFDLTNRTSFPEYLCFYNANGTPARHQAYVDLNEPSLSNPSLGLKDEGFVPVDEIGLNTSDYRSTYTRGYVHLNFYPVDGLTLTGKFQYEDLTGKRTNTAVGESYAARHMFNLFTENGVHKLAEGGILDETNITDTSYTFRLQATYDKTIKELHAINAVAGYEYRYQKSDAKQFTYTGYDEKGLNHFTGYTNFDDLVNAKNTDLGTLYSANNVYMASYYGNFWETKHKFLSYYATANYTFDRRYTVSGSFRIDEADLFGADKKFTRRPLWSVGAGWNMHNEAFLNDVTWINQLKPRLSYGVTGNINSNYSSYLTASINTNGLIGAPIALLNTPPNDQLRWEKTKSFDLGVDFSFFNYRLNGSVDYYNKQGSDILSLVDLDPTTGWSSLNMNNAGTRNRGFELQLSGIILEATNPQQVGLSAAFNIAYNNNKVTKIQHISTTGWAAIQSNDYKKDYPVRSLYSYKYGGVTYDQGYQDINWIDSNGELNYMDISSSAFTPEDVVYSGNIDPKWSGSFTPTVTYQNFTLSAMAAFYLGHYMRANYNEWTYSSGINYGSSAPAAYLNYWQASPDQQLDMIGNGYMMQYCTMQASHVYFADKNVDHADYMKLRNVVLTYSFPAKMIRKLGLSALKLRAQANNVATWARNK